MVESMIIIFIYFLFFYFRYSTKSDVWAIGMTMYEVIKLKNVFSEKNNNEIKKEIKNIFKSGSCPKLEESEELYNKEMINTINLMLNVYVYIYIFYIVIINFFFIAN
jgi:serine/threonine protein kinase